MQARIRRASLLTTAAITLAVVLGGTALAQSGSEVGSWKLNVAKSKYAPGTEPKSATVKFATAGAGVKSTIDSVGADGTVRHWEYTANYDGKDNPITGNSQYGDTVARTRVDANTVKVTYKKAGKVTTTQTGVISSDGKTRTITSTGTDALGKPVSNTQVFDRQ